MRIEPGRRRSSVERTAAGYQATIPGRLRLVGIFLLAWFGAWTAGGVGAMTGVRDSWHKGQIDWFLLFWLAMWLVGELSVVAVLVYMVAGKEVITLDPGRFVVRIAILGAGWTWEYDPGHISNLRLAPPIRPRQQPVGTIAFDYGAKTVRVAMDIDEAEAAVIISELAATRLLPRAAAA